MENSYIILFLCILVMLSYVYTLLSRYTQMPSVILLLATGIGLRWLSDKYNVSLDYINNYVQVLGTVGLIMIVLEAALDLHLTRDRIPLIRNSFLSALIILAVTVLAIAGIIHYWQQESFMISVVYAIPLSIISSSIIIPSVTHLGQEKKEFLVYEASFSDIIGIMVFNYFTAREVLSWQSSFTFIGGILIGVIISLVISLFLIYLLTKITVNIKFFLIFSILIFLYVSGKMFHLPSLIIIMIFGLMINNWHLLKEQKWLKIKILENGAVQQISELLKSITAESAFLIRTFFFVSFGYSIDVMLLTNSEVVVVGSAIVAIMLLTRAIFLGLFLKSSIFPEVLLMPRGLITILLFYIIPDEYKLKNFNEGILFFVVIITAILMMIGLMIENVRKPVGKPIPEDLDS